LSDAGKNPVKARETKGMNLNKTWIYFRYFTKGATRGIFILLRARLGDLAIEIEVQTAAKTGRTK